MGLDLQKRHIFSDSLRATATCEKIIKITGHPTSKSIETYLQMHEEYHRNHDDEDLEVFMSLRSCKTSVMAKNTCAYITCTILL